MTIDAHAIARTMDKVYDDVYFADMCRIYVPKRDLAYAIGEWLINNDKQLMGALYYERDDVVSSDREVEALGFAYMSEYRWE